MNILERILTIVFYLICWYLILSLFEESFDAAHWSLLGRTVFSAIIFDCFCKVAAFKKK